MASSFRFAPAMLALALGGCATLADFREYRAARDAGASAGDISASIKDPVVTGSEPVVDAGSTSIVAEASADAATSAAAAEREERSLGTGEFVNRTAATRPHGRVPEGDVVFNFENTPIQVVIKAILGELLEENYVIAPGVQGNVTFSTSRPINASQARAVLETLLSWNNLALVYKDGRYTVLPTAQALPGNLSPRMGPMSQVRGFEARVVPLRYIAPTEMEKILAPYVRQGAIVRADNARSLLVLAGTASELTTYLDTIEIFDVDWLAGMSVGVFQLERVEATKVLPDIEKIFGEGGATPLAGMFRFMPIERMNAVLVITPQPAYLDTVGDWLRKLDRGGSDAGAQLYVYYVKNVKATDLAENLTEIFTGQSSASGDSSGASIAGVAPGLQPVEIRTIDQASDPSKSAPPPPPAGGSGTGGGISLRTSDDIRISAIEESNALLIRATPAEYDSILAAIKRLDEVPLQVHIEAKILSVTLSNNLSLGVEWYFENQFSGEAQRSFRVNNRGFGTEREGTNNAWNSYAGRAGNGGLTWTFLNTSAEALLSSLQSTGDAQVLSAPSLVVLNNKEATINVGTQLPVVSSFISGVGTGTGVDPGTGVGGFNPGVGQSLVQFRNTGITLKVTPRVNPGGLVFMEISQEDSQPLGADTAVAGNVAVSQRQISTEIAVQGGQTVLLGGLIRDRDSVDKSGVPGLSQIPIVGALFGRNAKATEREELLVLITPTVIENADRAQSMTDEYRQRFRGLQPLIQREQSEREVRSQYP
jgi:general secretion pathway protein D